jgi:carbonic anhydrase/acetyltransferase-like protein (isoleucine patch superfamily)
MKQVRDFFLSPHAVIVGDVTIGTDTNIWPFVCARGDVAPVKVGARCSVQDHSMLHCKYNIPLVIEDDVLIGHHAVVHCTRVGSFTLVGIGARILDEATVGQGCIVAAGAVVPPKMAVPDGKLVAGVPAKILRDVTDADRAYIKDVLRRYVILAKDHVAGKFPPIG